MLHRNRVSDPTRAEALSRTSAIPLSGGFEKEVIDMRIRDPLDRRDLEHRLSQAYRLTLALRECVGNRASTRPLCPAQQARSRISRPGRNRKMGARAPPMSVIRSG